MKTIDCTPTWAGLLPALLHLLTQRGTPAKSVKIVETELARMAEAADKWNAHCKAMKEAV